MSQPPAVNVMLPMKRDDPCRFRQVQRMGERGAVRQPPRTLPSLSLAITGLSSRSTPTAIALATRAGVFQRKHRGRWRLGGGGPCGDACSTQPRTRLRHPAVDRTVVTDLMWWPRIPHGKDRAARRDPLARK
jgi:hypothetical protein